VFFKRESKRYEIVEDLRVLGLQRNDVLYRKKWRWLICEADSVANDRCCGILVAAHPG